MYTFDPIKLKIIFHCTNLYTPKVTAGKILSRKGMKVIGEPIAKA